MTYESVKLEQLQETLPRLVRKIHDALTDNDRAFLLAFKRGFHNWQDFAFPKVEKLPAIQWKLLNLARMDPSKRSQAEDKLETILTQQFR